MQYSVINYAENEERGKEWGKEYQVLVEIQQLRRQRTRQRRRIAKARNDRCQKMTHVNRLSASRMVSNAIRHHISDMEPFQMVHLCKMDLLKVTWPPKFHCVRYITFL